MIYQIIFKTCLGVIIYKLSSKHNILGAIIEPQFEL